MIIFENIGFKSGGRRQRFIRLQSLRTLLSVIFANADFLLSQTRSLVASAFGLSHSHAADVSSLDVVVAGYLYDKAGDLETKMCGAAKKSPAGRRG